MHEGQVPGTTMPDGLTEIITELERTWPAHLAALRASGVPLNADDDDPDDAAGDKKPAKKPPWGDDADFDAEKAWKLIQNLRAENDTLKTEVAELKTTVKKFEDADKSDSDKATERAATAEKEAADAKRDAARLRIALTKGLTETQAKRLVGDTEEELAADADDLLETFGKNDDPGKGSGSKDRPTEKLRPGAAPDAEPEETDPVKLAEQVPRMY